MKESFNALRLRFYSFFVLFVLALFSVVAITSFQQQQSVVSIAVSIAGMPILERAYSYIDGDKYERLVQTLDPNDPFYIQTQAKFRELRNEMQVQYLYSMAICPDGYHRFIFDGEDPDSYDFSYLGEIEDVDSYDSSYLLTYITGAPQYTRRLYDNTGWGRLVSAYIPIFNSSGEVVGVVGVDFDGDEIHEAIMASLWQLITLALGLAVIGVCLFFLLMRALSGQNEKLETALIESNAASIAKSNFLSNMSHEMRTPMNAIIGMTAIGKKAVDIEKKNQALNKIEEASSHLLGVISDILDMSKIEAGKANLVPVEFNMERMVHKILTVINLRIDEKKQTLSVNISSDVPRRVFGDDQRLSQVITNLLSNAVKFTPDEGVIILNISLCNETEDYCELRFEVIDNGIGVSPDKQDKLFVAFEQADDITHRNYGGTGLGLSISKRIVEMMNGKIWVESELGKGAAFIFTIQIKRSKNTENTSNENYHIKDGEEIDISYIGKFKGKHLLVVEDVAINREILVSLLEDSGLIIDCAENGKEALDMIFADPEKYDLVFMDLQMPVMDGFEAARLIRAMPTQESRNLPIVAMTANVFKDDIDACIEAGMNDHLGKPLDMDKVFDKLVKYLGINN